MHALLHGFGSMGGGRGSLTTSYDEVPYPSGVITRTNPDRLAVLAKLHGLDPAALDGARFLEIGCGEGHNLMGLAAAYPDARFEGFDLADTAIRAGQAKAAAAGLDNVRLWTGDILTARECVAPGSFDYIIAHGVYAWVPAVVRDAVMDLAAHALASHGVFYVSYHALPGGYFRHALRDLLLHEVGEIANPVERLAKARGVLSEIISADFHGGASVACLRELAEAALDKPEHVLFHDELGDVFAPQSLTDTVTNAERAGLRYLNDADAAWVHAGFSETGLDVPDDRATIDRQLVRSMQRQDNRNTCYFRWSLFTTHDAPVSRTLNLSVLDQLWASSDLTYDDYEGQFVAEDGRKISVPQFGLERVVRQIAAARPGRLALRGLLENDEWRATVLHFFAHSLINLHAGPAPFITIVGERPEASPFVRFAIGENGVQVPRLDHRNISLDRHDLRAVLVAADGTRTIAEIAREVEHMVPADQVEATLNAAAAIALMRR